MREEYHVTLYSQMGPREGRLDLQYEGSAVTGSLELMGRRNPVHGVRSEDGHLCLSHAIRTAVSTLFCETAGAPWGTPHWSDHGGRLPDAMGGEPDLP